MIGAIAGDIIGSRFEFTKPTNKNFELFTKANMFTDDTVMTLAVAKSLMLSKDDKSNLSATTVKVMRDIGRKYPRVGWGIMFFDWLFSDNEPKPYNSLGNGSAMRISSVAWVADNEEEVKELSNLVTAVTHNHPDGLTGAEAIAMATYLARIGATKAQIRERMIEYYPILCDKYFTLNYLTEDYYHDYDGYFETCPGSVPESILAFLESESYEDAIRKVILIGGDCDTTACMTGAIAEAYYGIPEEIKETACSFLDSELLAIVDEFNAYKKTCTPRS